MNTKSVYFLKLIFVLLSILLISSGSLKGQNLTFVRHPIDLTFDGIHRVIAIDLDGDSDLDIIGGSETTPTTASKGLAWWRNEGNNNWTRFTIDASYIHVMCIDTADINNDSYVDVIASSWQLHQIVWLKNSGDPTQGWTRYTIKSNFINAHDAKCGDFDDDGDPDIVGVNNSGSVVVFENNGSLSNWPSTVVSSSFGGALSAFTVDLDKDDDIDIVATASNDNQIAWWKNNGGSPSTWPKNVIASNFVGASGIDVIDMNKDNQDDIISNAWKSNQVAYWICDSIQINTWSKYTVSNQLDTSAAIRGSDMDNDGDIDIVAVGKIPGELVVYQNSDSVWNTIQLQDNFYGGADLAIADLDKDGDQDIIACASYLGLLYWWENTTINIIKENDIINVFDNFILEQNYPNPFNPLTKINYQIPKSGFVSIKVYDVLGKIVDVLVNEKKLAGNHEINFNGAQLTSGIYYYRIQIGGYSETKKMLLIE
ncbi:FG-GAP-like repeat-containing protein [Calditrichota bacterium]